MTWDQSFPVREYPIKHGLAQCWLVIMVFVSEMFPFKNVCAHVSGGKCAYPYPSRSTCCVFLPRATSCPQPRRGVWGCVLLPQASAHRPASALSLRRDWPCSLHYMRIFWPLFCFLLHTLDSFDPWWPTEAVQVTFLDLVKSNKGHYLSGCSNASFQVLWGAFREQFVEEQLAAGDWWKPSATPASPKPGAYPARTCMAAGSAFPEVTPHCAGGLEKHGRVSAGNPLPWA